MRIVVQKYGGSSVADLDRIRAVADRIAGVRADGTAVCVVVSAMGNTTNELLTLARDIAPTPDRRELDMLISVGERVTMALLAMCLVDRGVPARSLTGSQSGIVTDEAHADARVVEVRADRLRQVLARGEVAIVAGFQGVSREREVTTLGRGGSDTTAVVLAAALGAEHAEICSDVDGVWSADPRIVPDAVKLDTLSLDEALALARGAERVAVIGGGELYALALPHADELVLTEIDAAFDGADTFFPPFERTRFVEVAREPQHAADGTRFAFVTYRRREPAGREGAP
jgi:aspartate kinase